MRISRFVGSALCALVLGAPGAARADNLLGGDPDAGRKPTGALESRAQGSRIALTADLWPTRDWVTAAAGINGQIEVHRNFALDFDVPWAVGNTRSLFGATRGTGAAFGNITVGGHGIIPVASNTVLFAGVTVSIPTRYDFQNVNSTALLVQAFGALGRAYVDVHRLFPGVLFIRAPLGAEVRFAGFLYYRGDLTFVTWVPVAEDYRDKSAQLTLEHADEIEARAPFGLGGGVRLQAAFAPAGNSALSSMTSSGFGGGDRAQVAIEPFLGYEPRGSGVFARLGLLVALDSPAGPGFDRDKLAVIRMTVGGKF